MGADRVAALEAMLRRRPDDLRLRFGLALEYLRAGRLDDGIRELRGYLSSSDDEGNAWGRLGAALREAGEDGQARDAYRRGVEAAYRHGHPTMAAEFEDVLEHWDR
ncbi:MAG TPA: tetratricopeptide repeat protein [Longimicrobiales bacterium]|nr:tetratricopeptide repeat protein [Longimicrobiales bacterium]